MKILVVGGAGYVGGGIVDTLSKKMKLQFTIPLYMRVLLEKMLILFMAILETIKKLIPF